MERLLRVLVLTGGFFLVVFGLRAPVAAQQGGTDGSCCGTQYEEVTSDYPCSRCSVGGHGGSTKAIVATLRTWGLSPHSATC